MKTADENIHMNIVVRFQDNLQLRSEPPLKSLAAGRFLTSADKLPNLSD